MYNLRRIKRNSKCRMYEEMHARALSNDETALWKVYGRYSYSKEKAEEYCREMFRIYNGYKYAIISHNSFTFSVGFYYDWIDPDTDEAHIFFVRITPTDNICWEVPLD